MAARSGSSRPRNRLTGPLPDDTPWMLMVYRVPTESSRARVAVWRDLKRLGGLYLQQCVCVLPKTAQTDEEIDAIRQRVAGFGGTSNLFEISVDEAQRPDLIGDFRALAAREYAEIIEECETKFVKEIEFERFRSNYTFEEVEEIRHDLDKIRRWFGRVVARDWFGGAGRAETERWIERCAGLLDAFEEDVYTKTAEDDADPARSKSGGIKPPRTPADAADAR
jgi:hypothetical protein